MTKEEKKLVKAEKKQARKERRAQNPSRVRRSITEVKGGVESVRELYHEMNLQLNGEFEPDAEYDEAEETEELQHVAHMRHAKGKFKIRTKPTTWDMLGFIVDNELRTPSGIIGAVIDVAVFILFIVSLFSGSGYSIILLLVVFILTVLLIGPFSHLPQAYSASKNACSEEGGAEYTFSTAGFDIQYNSGEYIRFTWDSIYRVQESKAGFYFFLDEGDGFVIPKKDLAAAGRKNDQFEELLDSQIGNRFRKTYIPEKKPEKV